MIKFLTTQLKWPILQKGCLQNCWGTFALAYVVLNVATAKGTSGNSFYGLAMALLF